jgi:hypothetical protein
MKRLLLLLPVAVLVAAPLPAQESADTSNAELREIFEQDQAARSPGGNLSQSDDEARIKRVLELIAAGEVSTPEDRFRAAVVLQHTPRTWCEGKLTSQGTDNYLLAHFLAREAFDNGVERAGWLSAAAIDRYLVSSGKPQKYGTQRSLNRETGKMELDPIDPATTDEERAALGVPPLKEILERSRGGR